MELELWVVALLCLAYFSAGYIDSIAGGGGLLTIPAILLAGVPADLAIGTTKLSATFGMSMALRNYARSGLVIWKAATAGVPAVILGSILGSSALLSMSNEMIGKVVVFLLPLGILVTFLPKEDRGEREPSARQLYVYLPLVCLVLGFYEGFFGPGAGSFMLMALHFMLGFGMLASSGTMKLLNVTATGAALMVFIYQGKVLYLLAIPLTIAAVSGNYFGSRSAIRVGPKLIRKILAVSLSLLFASLIYKIWFDS
ncbi:TSUP family transporter [Desulfovibrio sp. OttesenSCG-928-I05]|nr:TSUP family transporter [Desulfovibrio sp. OttesenSCG-928-I05]